MIRCNNCMSVFKYEEDMPMMQLGEDYTYACPNCKTDEYLMDIDKEELKSFKNVWEELEDVYFYENEDGELILAEDWYFFTKGTSREDVWHGLEDLYGVAIGDLL